MRKPSGSDHGRPFHAGVGRLGSVQGAQSQLLTAHIPCVAVTAHTDRDRVRALQSGFSDFVGKPYRTEELLLTVKRLGREIEYRTINL